MATGTNSVLVIFFLALMSFVATSNSTPFIFLHGIGDSCAFGTGNTVTGIFAQQSGTQGECIEIGNGAFDSWLKPIEQQIDTACSQIKARPALSQGYNLVGVSQGNIIARGVIEFCDGPPVRNYISIAGPQAGITAVPCNVPALCNTIDSYLRLGIYTDFVQNNLAPSNYMKLPDAISEYLRGCKVLPRLNNELPQKDPRVKQRFSSLENLVLIMNALETVLNPKETSWFGFYADGSTSQLLAMNETKLYQEDWIGLRALNEAGKVKLFQAAGIHAVLTPLEVQQFVVPYLKN